VTLSNGVKVTKSERWLYPCAGSTTAEVVDNDVIILAENEAKQVVDETKTRQNESVDWNDTLKTLTEKTVKLKKKVHALKKLYVSEILSFLFPSVYGRGQDLVNWYWDLDCQCYNATSVCTVCVLYSDFEIFLFQACLKMSVFRLGILRPQIGSYDLQRPRVSPCTIFLISIILIKSQCCVI